MKKILLLLFVIAACLSVQAENVAFLKAGGTNGDGKSATTPTTSINTAHKILEDLGGGGTIVVIDSFSIGSTWRRAIENTKNITFTSVWDGIDYRVGNPRCGIHATTGFRYVLNGPHTFENMRFIGHPTTQTYIMFLCNYNPIVMGEGIECVNFPTTQQTTGVSIIGGAQSLQNVPASTELDSYVTIKSGKFIVIGFNRDITGPYSGTAHINISGGEINAIYGGSISSSGTEPRIGGSLDLNISGGTFSGYFQASNFGSTGRGKGNANVTISGGTFNNNNIVGSIEDGTATISIHANPELLPALWTKVSGFDKTEIIIPADVTATAEMYNSGADIIFESNETSTGQLIAAAPLTLDGAVKVKKTFTPDALYSMGFPFAMASYSANSVAISVGTDFEAKSYNGGSNLFASASEMVKDEGYTIQFGEEFEDTEVTFTSAANPVLSNFEESDLNNLLSEKSDGYYLIANPSASNLTLTEADRYYVFDGTNFTLMASGTKTIKPFEPFVITKNITPATLYSTIGGGGMLTALEWLPVNEKIIGKEYYNLQGQRISQPGENTLHIVKTLYVSGKSKTMTTINHK